MNSDPIPRRLAYEEEGQTHELRQAELPARFGSMVILGEAGMGKSELARWLGEQVGHARCNARDLLNCADPRVILGNATTLVIDSLDEVPAQGAGDAVDLVLRKLGTLNLPRFALTCRVADWRSATSRSAIRGQYGADALELRLLPFDQADARAFLEVRVGREVADKVMVRFSGGALSELLGNPQTLGMLAKVAEKGPLPESLGGLFDSYVALAWHEHNEERPDDALERFGQGGVLDALGAAYAALILTGAEAVSRRKPHLVAATDLALPGIAALPGAAGLAVALGSRLTQSASEERFGFPHKRIGEYLGARWLARTADTPRQRRRLLALFHQQGLVPASLRGLYAWLVWHGPDLAEDVIAADPMGVIEYGDADALSPAQGRALLVSLRKLASENPRFREWGSYAARGLVQRALLPELRALLAAPGTEFGLRLLALEQLKGAEVTGELVGELRALLIGTGIVDDVGGAVRNAAGEVLLDVLPQDAWPPIIEDLIAQDRERSAETAVRLVNASGYSICDDQQTMALLVAHAKLKRRSIGLFYRVRRDLPDDRLDSMLDLLVKAVAALGKSATKIGMGPLTDLAFFWLVRRLKLGPVVPVWLLEWLGHFDRSVGVNHDSREELAAILRADHQLRRAIQSLSLLGVSGDVRLRVRSQWLNDKSVGFVVTEGDVVSMLSQLDPANRRDQRWCQLIWLIAHSETEGALARDAARAFAAHRPDLMGWLNRLAKPKIPKWQQRQDVNTRKRRARQAMRWHEHRQFFANHADQMRGGLYGRLFEPAQVYLRLFDEFDEFDEDMPPEQRLTEWLGQPLAQAARGGFEAFLQAHPPWPRADQIAESAADGRNWTAAWIIVVAMAERHRMGTGFTDLPDERLLAGVYELWCSRINDHAGIDGLIGALETEVRKRGLWEAALRGYIEPHFAARREHIEGLYRLMHGEDDATLATALAAEWLERFPDVHAARETEMIDRLIGSGDYETLRRISAARRVCGTTDNERRRNWLVVELLVDFQNARGRLDAPGPPEAAILWHLRARLGGREGERMRVALSVEQLVWIVRRFRAILPMVHHPSGSSEGSHNPWDAASFLVTLIARLGDDTSPQAVAAMATLRDAPADGYTNGLKRIAAEQQRKRVEETFRPATLADLAAVTGDAVPRSAADLQPLLIEELSVLEKRFAPGGDNANPIAGFYKELGKTPKGENDCRDHLLALLRGQLLSGITAEPEGSAGGRLACDIACSIGSTIRVPIEIKGQWHKDLWHAADTQLDRLYTQDWRAERRGIYLVLWFGDAGKPLHPPPQGTPRPSTPEELRDALVANSDAARYNLVEIIVLDLSRDG